MEPPVEPFSQGASGGAHSIRSGRSWSASSSSGEDTLAPDPMAHHPSDEPPPEAVEEEHPGGAPLARRGEATADTRQAGKGRDRFGGLWAPVTFPSRLLAIIEKEVGSLGGSCFVGRGVDWFGGGGRSCSVAGFWRGGGWGRGWHHCCLVDCWSWLV
jgi:hypothetical protein